MCQKRGRYPFAVLCTRCKGSFDRSEFGEDLLQDKGGRSFVLKAVLSQTLEDNFPAEGGGGAAEEEGVALTSFLAQIFLFFVDFF